MSEIEIDTAFQSIELGTTVEPVEFKHITRWSAPGSVEIGHYWRLVESVFAYRNKRGFEPPEELDLMIAE